MITTALFNFIPTAHAQIGLDFLNLPPGAEIGDVLSRLYVWGVGLVAIIAVIMLVIGGVQYMVAGDKDPSSAKERIRNAIWGLILALCSYLILYTINPDLTKKVILTPIEINVVAPPTPSNQLPTFRCSTNGIEYPTAGECNTACTGGSCTNTPPPTVGKWLCESNTNSNGNEFPDETACKAGCSNTGNTPGSCTKLE